MDIEEFGERLRDEILMRMGPAYENFSVVLSEKPMNNGGVMHGISFRGAGYENLSPVVYYDKDYECFVQNDLSVSKAFDDFANTCIEVLEENKDRVDSLLNLGTDALSWESAKGKIMPRLVNRSMNEEILKDRPFTEYLDLAVTYHIVLSRSSEGIQSIAVNNSILRTFGVSAEDLHAQAVENLSKEVPNIISMTDMMSALLDDDLLPEDEIGLTILSNNDMHFGSAMILAPGVMDTLSERMGGDFYLLPSSVHEVLALPSMGASENELSMMVRDINRSSVDSPDVLSDHCYYYDAERKELLNPEDEKKLEQTASEDANESCGMDFSTRSFAHGR